VRVQGVAKPKQLAFGLLTSEHRDFFGDVVVFDVETTFTHPQEIIQIAALRIRGNRIVGQIFHSFVKPSRRIDLETTSFTGISNRHVKDAPKLREILIEFSNFCAGAVLIAHNGRQFDFRLLQQGCHKMSQEMREVRFIDSMHLSWAIWGRFGRRHGLSDVAFRLKIRTIDINRHDARYDVRVLADCLLKMTARFKRSRKDHQLKYYLGMLPLGEVFTTNQRLS
jgi:DNA polymerase III epsilon subunit family exonuclease